MGELQGWLGQLAFDPAALSSPEVLVRLGLQVVLFGLSACFSMSETALFSISRVQLKRLWRMRHRRSEKVHELLDHPRRLIISVLCGNELINIAATANLAGVLLILYGNVEQASVVNVLVMFPLLLLFSEITPKTLAVSDPVRISADFVARPMALWVKLVAPLRGIVRVVSDKLTTLIVGEERAHSNLLKVDEIRTLIEEVEKQGVLSARGRVLIDNLMRAGETQISRVMVPRPRVQFVSADMSVKEIVEAVRTLRFGRIPVYRDNRDTLVGMVHAEQIALLVHRGQDLDELSTVDIIRPALAVPPTKTIAEMYEFFRQTSSRSAMVINEWGGVDGMITVRDLLSFIFGELLPHEAAISALSPQPDGSFEVPGGLRLSALNDATNFGLRDPYMATVGGLVLRQLGRAAGVGDTVTCGGVRATVLAVEGHRISRVHLTQGQLRSAPVEQRVAVAGAAHEAGVRAPVHDDVDAVRPKEPGTTQSAASMGG